MDLEPRPEWEKGFFAIVMLMWPLGIVLLVWKLVAGDTTLDGISVIGAWVMERVI